METTVEIKPLVEPAIRVAAPLGWTRHYALGLLTLVGTVNFLDRQVMTILLEPIRRELSLSDTQIGFVTGIAFTLTYVTLAIPVARLADRWSRRKVIALAVSVWSVMTIFCGLAQNFTQLFLARFGVGFGEAGGSAPTQALVGDLYGRKERATAMSIYVLSTPIGMALGLLWGGWAVSAFGWRSAFMLAGVPGLIIALLMIFTLPERQKGLSDGIQAAVPQPPFRTTLRLIWSIRSLRNMMFASMLQTFLALGISTWVPSFLARSYGMSSSKIGASLAVTIGIGYTLGPLIGGPLIDLLGRRDPRWHFWIPTVAAFFVGGTAAYTFMGSSTHVFLMLGVYLMFASLFAGPFGAISQNLVPVSMRATTSACMLFVINSIAIGLGPQAVGIISDHLRPAFGENSLRITLLGATSIALPAAFFFFRASLTYRADLAAADARNKAP